jgi:hypothetical protein
MRRVEFGRLGRTEIIDAPKLVECGFQGALLVDCKFHGGTLCRCSFERAILRIVDFGGVWFNNVGVQSAEINRCDLRGARGLRLDDNLLINSTLTPYSQEPWSVLRRSYTGPKMAFNLIFLALFFAPFLSSGFLWLALNRAEGTVSAEITLLKTVIAPALAKGGVESELAQSAIQHLDKIGRCLQEKCNDYSVWQLLLGLHQERWWFVLFTVVLVVYNALRLALTLLVAPLRAEEERSNHTPPRLPSCSSDGAWFVRSFRFIWSLLKSYGWLEWPHWIVFAFGFAALLSGVVNGFRLLTRVVSIPA